MTILKKWQNKKQQDGASSCLNSLVLLAIRLYLAPIMLVAGLNKLQHFSSTVQWFGNDDWGLGLMFAPFWVVMVIFAEIGGAVALLFGALTRVFAVLLVITMTVAAWLVHLPHGWFAISPNAATSTARAFFWLPSGAQSLHHSQQAQERLVMAKKILAEHGDMGYLTQFGDFAIIQNGMEFAITYLIMLMVLVVHGAGRASIDALWVRYASR